ncbi:MAG TPA: DNA damage-inducible protein D [Candidatus Paceibacterota bacterium]
MNEITGPSKTFEEIKRVDENGVEYWTARELMVALGYSKWVNFEEVIKKAKKACVKSSQFIENHFADVGKMVGIGSRAFRKTDDYKLDRYACYLVAQNGDSGKEAIALAQTYFAVQSRKQEIFEGLPEAERRLLIRGEVSSENKKLFKTARQAGVSNFGLFNDAGYKGLYGISLVDIEARKGIKKGELLDRAGATELAANLFRITQTDSKLQKDKTKNELEARRTHFVIGGKVRQTIKDIGGELPENLKPEKHIKEFKKESKELLNKSKTRKLK